MTTTLNFWDFDGSLIDSPMPEPGKANWELKTGKKYPHVGWWSKPESLDTDIHEISPKYDIFLKWKDSKHNPESIDILLTSRLKKLELNVINVLSKHDITMDYYSFANGPLNKGQRVLQWLETLDTDKTIKEINVYEDRDIEIQVLETVRQKLEEAGIKYNIHKVD
jgi:hypothetical protein